MQSLLPCPCEGHVLYVQQYANLLLLVLCFAMLTTAAAPSITAPPQGPNLRQQHLHAMLQLVLPWVTPAGAAIEAARQSAAGGEERLLSACRCLLAAARVHRSAGFDAASAALGLPAGSGGLLGLLSDLTTAVLAAAGSDPGWWENEASELLLEMWVELVADPCRGPMGGSQAAVAAAAAVFAAVVEAGLQQAAAEAQEDEGGLRGCTGLCVVHGRGGVWAGEWVEQGNMCGAWRSAADRGPLVPCVSK